MVVTAEDGAFPIVASPEGEKDPAALAMLCTTSGDPDLTRSGSGIGTSTTLRTSGLPNGEKLMACMAVATARAARFFLGRPGPDLVEVLRNAPVNELADRCWLRVHACPADDEGDVAAGGIGCRRQSAGAHRLPGSPWQGHPARPRP